MAVLAGIATCVYLLVLPRLSTTHHSSLLPCNYLQTGLVPAGLINRTKNPTMDLYKQIDKLFVVVPRVDTCYIIIIIIIRDLRFSGAILYPTIRGPHGYPTTRAHPYS